MFVTLEGPEGAGKSTCQRTLGAKLEAAGFPVLLTREPGAGALGARIREVLLGGEAMPPESELFLFLADRSNHVRNVILPALTGGKIVLCDRYADSTIVYQAHARGLNEEFLRKANQFATGGLIPDLTLLFDLPPEIGLSRLTQPDRLDKEPLEFHQKVRIGFLEEAKREPGRWRILDASKDPQSVLDLAWAEISSQLG